MLIKHVYVISDNEMCGQEKHYTYYNDLGPSVKVLFDFSMSPLSFVPHIYTWYEARNENINIDSISLLNHSFRKILDRQQIGDKHGLDVYSGILKARFKHRLNAVSRCSSPKRHAIYQWHRFN